MKEPKIDILKNLKDYLTRHPYQEDGTELTEAIVRIMIGTAEIEQLQADKAELVEGIVRAEGFVENGVDLGFIRMPDPDTPDLALGLLPLLRSLIAKHSTSTPTTEGNGNE